MARRVLSAVLMALVLAALPVAWVVLSRASVATAAMTGDGDQGNHGHGDHPRVTVVSTLVVVETVRAVTTVVQTVRATATVNHTLTARSVTTSTSTVSNPGPTVVRTLAGGQVVHTVLATPSPSPSATTALDAADRGLAVDPGNSGSPIWPYVLGVLVLALAGVVGLLVSTRD